VLFQAADAVNSACNCFPFFADTMNRTQFPLLPPRIAQRMSDIEPFYVMEILARARELEAQGRSIIHMEIGEPDFPTPPLIVDAGIAALQRGDTFYTPALGLSALREAISGFYLERHGVEVAASRIVVTPGSSGALLLAMGVLLNPGDEVLMADPAIHVTGTSCVFAREGQWVFRLVRRVAIS
jgi:aspartate/methionine/tyrosine aminotransferase